MTIKAVLALFTIVQARNCLEHLKEHFNAQAKYQELRDYFIYHLKELANKYQSLFKQKKWTRDDVIALNSCLVKFDSAKGVIGLRAHFSAEEISCITEDFLGQIINHFNRIHGDITDLTKKSNSKLFESIEPLFREMAMIREEIAMIEAKTSEAYFSTLEMLYGLMQEQRREVEHILNLISQQSKYCNYDHLLNCLSSLKNAKWIDEFKPGAYSDVMEEVQDTILKYVRMLKSTIMKTNLELDHPERISPTAQLLKELHLMKPLESIIPKVGEEIRMASEWFYKVTNNILEIIQKDFDPNEFEKLKHQPLDIQKAEKSFTFLEKCKSIELLYSSACTTTLDSLQSFIKRYSHFIKERIDITHTKILEFKEETKEEDS